MKGEALKDIPAMHAAYCQAARIQLPLDPAREISWYEVWRRGIRASDVTLLVNHLHAEIRAQRRNPGALKFRNFVGNADYLEEDLAELRARARVPKPNPARAAVLQATGRPAAPEPPPARSAGQVLSSGRVLEEIEKFKQELGFSDHSKPNTP